SSHCPRMMRGVRWYLVGSVILVTLAGCKPEFVVEERPAWRGEAEQACLKSGIVRESPTVVLLPPINGPGMCGADFPLKVSSLGEPSALGYEDEAVRPPGDVRGAPSYPAPRPSYPPGPQYPAANPAYPANPQYGAPQVR